MLLLFLRLYYLQPRAACCAYILKVCFACYWPIIASSLAFVTFLPGMHSAMRTYLSTTTARADGLQA